MTIDAELLNYLTPSELEELDSLLSSRIPEFPRWLKTVTPEFYWDWHYQHLIYQELERVTKGDCKKLMLFLPPRHGKSEAVTIRYPVWRLENNPNLKVVVAAYNQTLANKFSRKSRRIAEELFSLSKERAAVEDWETNEGGGLRAIGVGSGITGQGGDLIIIDDPVKSREEAESVNYRERVYDWYTDDVFTRREPGCALILIQTRWHQDDLAGRILASEDGPNWTVISLPALSESNDPLGRNPGDALCPQRYTEKDLEEIKRVLGERSFSALYQQQPRPSEGGLFKPGWFKIIDHVPADLRMARFWDLAASTKTTADYTAGAKVGVDNKGNIYILDMVHGRLEWPDSRKKIIETANQDGIIPVGVEAVAFQIAAVQDLKRDPSFLRIPLKEVRPDRDKKSRALPWAAKAEGGQVFLLRGQWTEGFIDECLGFEAGAAHDDRVDAVSGAVHMLFKSRGGQTFGFTPPN